MWIQDGKEVNPIVINDYIGFVYLITNKVSGRSYFGKKLFWFSKTSIRTKTVAGVKKKKKTKSKIESDWKEYWSSSTELQQDVLELGEDNFTREILYLCKTKGMMGYLEAKLQFKYEVLEHPADFYNGIINCKIHKTHVKLDQL